MKLDLILLNVTKNVDNEVVNKNNNPSTSVTTVNSSLSNTTNVSASSNSSNPPNIVRTLQKLSESIQCYGAASYLELSSDSSSSSTNDQGPTASQPQHQHGPASPMEAQRQQPTELTPAPSSSDTTTGSPTSTKQQDDATIRQSSSSSTINNNTSASKKNRNRKETPSMIVTPSSASDDKNMISQHSCLNEDVMATIGKQVLKYIKTSDRYMCLASCLLKSRAFHETYPSLVPPKTRRQSHPQRQRSLGTVSIPSTESNASSSTMELSVTTSTPDESSNAVGSDTTCIEVSIQKPTLQRPLINLPRTKHGKPYIPIAGGSPDDDSVTNKTSALSLSTNSVPNVNRKGEENLFPLSVSHQYPYVGMIRIDRNQLQQVQSSSTLAGSIPLHLQLNEDKTKDVSVLTSSSKVPRTNKGTPPGSPSTSSVQQQSTYFTKARPKQRKRGGSIDTKNKGATTQQSSSLTTDNNPTLLIGFDIVVFDEINYRLYDTVQDFVDVFRGMFSPAEFKVLHDSCSEDPEKQLRELYLRWAVKEAYTKALGVGLGYDFSSFQVFLDIHQSSSSSTSSIRPSARGGRNKAAITSDYFLWDWLCSVTNNVDAKSYSSSPSPYPKVYGVTGTVQQTNEKTRSNEHYAFFFCPLSKDDYVWNTTTQSSSSPSTGKGGSSTVVTTMALSGCACACVGPLNILSSTLGVADTGAAITLKDAAIAAMNKIECSVEWTDLEHLISWHSSSSLPDL